MKNIEFELNKRNLLPYNHMERRLCDRVFNKTNFQVFIEIDRPVLQEIFRVLSRIDYEKYS